MPTAEVTDPLLQILIDNGLLSSSQAGEAMEEQKRTGNSSQRVVIDLGLVSEEDLLSAIANHLDTTVVDMTQMEIPMHVIRAIPPSAARMYSVVPVEVEPDSITLATNQFLGPEVIDEIRFVLTRDVTIVLAPQEQVKNQIARYYGEDSASINDMLSALEADMETDGMLKLSEVSDDDKNAEELAQLANATPVIRFVNLVLYQAVQDGASDIHFEPFENEFQIRYRVDGALYALSPPPKTLSLPVISRIKVMSNLNIAERRLPQDGRLMMTLSGRQVDFRVSTLPTQFGESVVLRVLDRTVVSLELENLGMPNDVYEGFTRDIQKPNGIIIVTGPTGSGKTTTLYSALKRINSIESKLLTVEDPVEYDIEGIVQIQVNEAIEVTFQRVLRAFLRQDPDIIMIGEIRDLETAQIAIQASLTGHLVLTTLHTNDSPGAITRLIDMNVEPFLISSTLETVIGQRLVRKTCSTCKTPYKPDALILKQLDLSEEAVGDRQFFSGKGCQQCHQTGYKGRKGIYEYLVITDPIRKLINDRRPTLEIRNLAVEQGMRLLREDGLRNIMDGETTVEEILKYT